MKKLIFTIIVVGSFLLVGCSAQPSSNPSYITGRTVIESDIQYFKDTRYNICFAERSRISKNGTFIYSFAEVNCEKVEDSVGK